MRQSLNIYISSGFIFLLLLLCLRFIIFGAYIRAQKHHFREQALLTMQSGTKTLVIPQHQLYKDVPGMEWKEHNRELVIKGKYHEVLSVEKHDSDFHVLIIEDEEETRVFNSFFREKGGQKNIFNLLTSFLFGLNFTNQSPATMRAAVQDDQSNSSSARLCFPKGYLASHERPPAPPASFRSPL